MDFIGTLSLTPAGQLLLGSLALFIAAGAIVFLGRFGYTPEQLKDFFTSTGGEELAARLLHAAGPLSEALKTRQPVDVAAATVAATTHLAPDEAKALLKNPVAVNRLADLSEDIQTPGTNRKKAQRALRDVLGIAANVGLGKLADKL